MIEIRQFPLGELGTNCYLVYRGQSAFVVDPGGDPQVVVDFCRAGGIVPEFVVATHGHFDHVGGVAAVLRIWDIPFAASSQDAALIENASSQASLFGCQGVEDPPAPDVDLSSLSALEIGAWRVDLLHTPGHSPGSVTLRLEEHLLVGDVLFQQSIGRTDLPGGDYDTLIASITEKLFPVTDGIVYPGHGPVTTIATERATNPFLR